MSSPLKPWEQPGVNRLRSSISSSLIDSQPLPRSVLSSDVQQNPPPIPSRNFLSQNSELSSGYGFGYGSTGYSPGYCSYGGTGYGSYGGMYNGIGSYGGMYNGIGMNRFSCDNFSPGSFAHQAEMSSRQAFQSVESVVQAVGSVAALLESTFQAVYNSFRAVIGVADHMSRLKMYFANIFSTLALIRTLRWLASWLLGFLRVKQSCSEDDELWSNAAEQIISRREQHSNWPIMIFFAIIIGGPWLISKLLSSLSANTEINQWMKGKAEHYVAVAMFDFKARNNDELSFEHEAVITVAPKALQPRIRGWLLATVNGEKIGLIPANYVRILGKRNGTEPNSEHHGEKRTQRCESQCWDKDYAIEHDTCSDALPCDSLS